MTDEIMEGQITLADLDMQFTKMSQELSVPTKEKILEPCLKKPQKSQTKMPLFLDLRVESGHTQDASWETDGVSLGEYMMHNTGEFHKDENAYVYLLISTETPQERYCLNCSEKPLTEIQSKLSWILEQNPDPKYNLSAKACQGILRRAEKRGKALPKILKDALERQESDTMYTLNTVEQHAVCIENHPADSRVKVSEDGIVQTLSSRMETGGGNVPMVMESINGEISGTLDASYYKGCGERQGVEREVVCVGNGQLAQARISDKVGALNCMHDQQAIITYGLDRAAYNQGINAQYDFSVEEEKIGTQVAKGPGAVCSAVDCRNGVEDADKNGSLQSRSSNNINLNNVCRVGSVVRRLTPLECTRLQGFPDGWVNIGDWVDSNGKLHKDADSPKYKALGNSIALPFWQWMAERMMPYLPENPTMASLFDGIGGFPIVFSRVGCKPVWASEIEEFPIAVTKRRFPEE